MKTDRELLEAAANAAAYCVLSEWSKEEGSFDGLVIASDLHPFRAYWNPLTDDGDALRLAVKLGIDISPFLGSKVSRTRYIGSLTDRDISEPHGTDPDAATRRAIVRVAAEIGKATQA